VILDYITEFAFNNETDMYVISSNKDQSILDNNSTFSNYRVYYIPYVSQIEIGVE